MDGVGGDWGDNVLTFHRVHGNNEETYQDALAHFADEGLVVAAARNDRDMARLAAFALAPDCVIRGLVVPARQPGAGATIGRCCCAGYILSAASGPRLAASLREEGLGHDNTYTRRSRYLMYLCIATRGVLQQRE